VSLLYREVFAAAFVATLVVLVVSVWLGDL
jgi:hypothetical protein